MSYSTVCRKDFRELILYRVEQQILSILSAETVTKTNQSLRCVLEQALDKFVFPASSRISIIFYFWSAHNSKGLLVITARYFDPEYVLDATLLEM